MTFALKKGSGVKGEEDGKRREAESGEARAGGEERTKGSGIRRRRSAGSAVGMDGEAQTGGSVRELGVAWSILNQWQERAMEGMLVALQPRLRWTRQWH